MSLGPEDVSRVRLGALTPYAIDTLRLLRDFFGVTFQVTLTHTRIDNLPRYTPPAPRVYPPDPVLISPPPPTPPPTTTSSTSPRALPPDTLPD